MNDRIGLIQNSTNKMYLWSLSVAYAAHSITPPPPWEAHFTTPMSTNRSPTWCRTHYNAKLWRECSPKCNMPSKAIICPLKSVSPRYCSQVKTSVRLKSTKLSFPKMVTGFLCPCKPTDSSAVWVADLSWSLKWRHLMWRSRVTHGYTLWDLLDVLSNSLKKRWR